MIPLHSTCLRGADYDPATRQCGVSLSTRSAATVRDGPLAEVIAGLQLTAEQAADITAIAQDGRDMADATAVLLAQKLFARLQQAGELGPRDLEQVSLVQARLQTGIHRTRRLEADVQALQARLALREKELELAREKFSETKKSQVEKGLDALSAECKGNAEVMQLFGQFRDAVLKKLPGEAVA